MSPFAVSCIVFAVSWMAIGSYGNVVTVVDPVAVIPGNPYVVVMFDFHRRLEPNGNCTELNPRAVELLWSLRWIDEILQSNPKNKIGLVLHDTCGSERRTIQIVSRYLNPDECKNNTNFAGILSYTARDIRDNITNLVRPFGILHMEISNDQHLTHGSGTVFDLSTISMWKIQAAVVLLNKAGWSQVSSIAMDTDDAKAEQKIFDRMAEDLNLCVATSFVMGNTSSLSLLKSNVAVVFMTGHSDVDSIVSSLQQRNDTVFIVVGDQYLEDVSVTNTNNIVFLKEDLPIRNYLASYITKNIARFQESEPVTSEYLSNVPSCQENSTSGRNCSEDIISRITRHAAGRDMMAVLTSFFNLERLILTAQRYNCTDFNFLTCQTLRPYVALSIHQPRNVFPLKLYEVSENGWLVDEPANITVTTMVESRIQVGSVMRWKFTESESPKNSSLWQTFINQTTSVCKDNCSGCWQCSHKGHNDAHGFIDGDLFFGALFPIRQPSPNGAPCGELSWKSIQLAEAYNYALGTAQKRHKSFGLLPGVKLGGIVLDNCGLKGNLKDTLMSKKGCDSRSGHQYMNTDIMSTLQYDDDVFEKSFADEVDFHLSDNTVSSNTFSFNSYMDETATVLKQLNWTYISVIISSDVNSKMADQESIQVLKKHGICVAQIQIINEGEYENPNITGKLFRGERKTDVFLLLTNPTDTSSTIEQSRMLGASINLVLMSWNKPKNVIIPEGTLLVQPKVESQGDFQEHLNSLDIDTYTANPWLSQYHEHVHKCHMVVNNDIMYPEKCLTNATKYREISPLTSFVIDAVDLLVMSLDKVYKELCPEKQGICEAFLNNDDVKSLIKSKLSEVKLIKNGDTFVKMNEEGVMESALDVVNYQFRLESTQPEPMKVGDFTNGELNLNKNSVMTYDVNKIPFVTPHACNGYCPECLTCDKPQTQSSVDYVYSPGDIVLAAIAPIHNRGRLPFTCGGININNDTDYHINAILYAVNTAKSRYPKMFPNVSLGSIVLDSCSDIDSILKTLSNLETCTSSYKDANGVPLHPSQVMGYTMYGDTTMTQGACNLFQRLNIPSLLFGDSVSVSRDPISSYLFDYNPEDTTHVILELLAAADWTNVVIVYSGTQLYSKAMHKLLTNATNYDICVSDVIRIGGSNPAVSAQTVLNGLARSSANTVVVLASHSDVKRFLSRLQTSRVYRNFIFSEIDRDWAINDNLPLGSIVIDRLGKTNANYDETYSSKNPWTVHFDMARKSCVKNNGKHCSPSEDIDRAASTTILSVDVLLHVLHDKYIKLCPRQDGLCKAFLESRHGVFSENIFDLFGNVSFTYENERTIKMPPDGAVYGTFALKNYQTSGFEEIGRWRDGVVRIRPDRILTYDSKGKPYNSFRESKCFPGCECLNYDMLVHNATEPVEIKDPYEDLLFYRTSGEFDTSIWTIAILVLCGAGALFALSFIVYALSKVCTGLLERRYIALGITTLVSVMCLYLAVLPFMFTPSVWVCAARRVVPGAAYAFVFATILAKLMALRAYRLIGLGGEISNLNQFLAIIFIMGTQIAIGAQWLVNHDSFLITKADPHVMYACDFDKIEFVKYLVYVMFIIFLSAVYSLTVRNEKKNLGEARLILIATWLVTAVWVAWVVTINIQSRPYVEPSICISIFVCATIILSIMFVPKVYRIANLHYSVKKSGMENGGLGKIDYEFIFERPQSLPASNISTFNYADKTHPKSISTFDTNLSY